MPINNEPLIVQEDIVDVVALAIKNERRRFLGVAPLASLDGLPDHHTRDEKRLARVVIPAIAEFCAQACEQQRDEFLSPEYATNQPLSSFNERFACDQCATAIRSLSIPGGEG